MTRRSLLLIDCVLSALAVGEPVTARKVARTTGEDQIRVLRELTRLKELGIVKGRVVHSRSTEKPYEIFTPVGREVRSAMARREAAR